MSSSLAPQTLAERPPFRGGPPVRTTFDGGFAGDPDPDFELSLERAERFLKKLEAMPDDALPVTLRLLKQLYKSIESQLWGLRSVTSASLPPIRGFELDSFLETSDSLEGRFVRMLDMLNDAILKVQVKLDLQQCPFPLSEL